MQKQDAKALVIQQHSADVEGAELVNFIVAYVKELKFPVILQGVTEVLNSFVAEVAVI